MPEVLGILGKHYPDFVYDSDPSGLGGNIPVFTFHTAEREKFERQMVFLRNNSYRTLNADQLHECMTGGMPVPERSILITFDDGAESVWTTAYPLLKKYGFQAVCFIVPGLIKEKLEDGGKGNGNLCSWNEIRIMHEDGTIDFQSHTMYHSLIFVSPEIDDFLNPSYCRHNYNFNIPIFREGESDNIFRNSVYGIPIYKNMPRFSGEKRYYDDERLRDLCARHVKENGDELFFGKPGWRRELLALVKRYRKSHGETGHYESEKELRDVLYEDLLESRKTIERRLNSKTVRHVCYPWWVGCDLSVELSKEAGYLSNFWGIVKSRRTTNRAGDDPYRISRLIEDDFVLRLPGEGRESLSKIMAGKLLSGGKSFKRKAY